MNRGYYYAVNGMIMNQRKLDCIGNNLANVSTAGYKRDTVLTNTFDDQMILVQHRNKLSGTFTQRYVDTSYTDLDQSNFEYTDSPFDVAIWGDVYFNVRTNYPGSPNEIMLTRNGQWELDGEGYLSLNHSGRIQGENGDIYLGDDNFVIDVDGTIYRDYIGGERIDRLRLSYINPDSDVTKFGANMFTEVEAQDIPEGTAFDIVQGAVERSNVDWNYELNMLLEANRLYEANSSILKMIDGLNQGATSLCKRV